MRGGRQKSAPWLPALIATLVAAVFLIDLATPLGVADGIAYLVPVLLTSWLRRRRSTLVVAAVCTGLALLGFFLSPPGVGLALALTNRFLAFLGIWVVAGLSLARKGVEEELRRANRTLRVLSECNQVLVRARQETELLEQVCRLLVEEGGYRLAWVGYAEEDESKTVRPVAQAGFEEGEAALANITWAGAEPSRGPIGTAIRTGKPCVARDILKEPGSRPWRDEALKRGYASTIAVPLRVEGAILGSLNLYSAEPQAFHRQEVKLLSELAADLGYGIAALRSREERERAEQQFQQLVEFAPDALVLTNQRGEIVLVNTQTEKLLGYPRAELLGQSVDILVPERFRSGHLEKHLAYCAEPAPRLMGTGIERSALRKDNSEVAVEIALGPLETEQGLWVVTALRDITERKRAEKALRQSEASLAEAQRIAHLGSWEWNIVTNELFWSDEVYRIFGLAPQAFGATYEAFLERVHPDDREQVATLVEAAVRQRQPYSVAHRVVRPDGALCVVHERGEVSFDPDGQPVRMVGTVLDITEQKRREELDRFFTLSIDLLCVAGFDGYFKRLNPSWEKLFGYAEEELLGRPYFDFVHPEDHEATVAEAARLAAGGVVVSFENRYRAKDGSYRWLLWKSASDPGRELIYAAARDITERKQAEDVRARLAAIVESSDDAILGKDLDGTILSWNAGAEKMYGYTAAEAIGRHISLLMPPDRPDEIAELLKRIGRGERILHYETERVRKDGSRLQVSLTLSPLKDAQGQIVGASSIARDITERKQAEEALQLSNSQLEAINKELEAFTYSVSHDLRAPLRHIDGFARILLEDFGPRLDPEARKYLERIGQGTRQMGALIDDLLNLARVGRQEIRLQVTGLRSLVEEVRAGLQRETAERTIDWQIGALPFVECDPALMKQVFANLLANAVKFTRPRPRARIEVGQMEQNGQPVVFVRDNGVGFSMKYAHKLFGVFQRLHRQEDFEGTGVGLATVQRIIHKHGGRVWAEAELDKGAAFYFTLGTPEPEPAVTLGPALRNQKGERV